MLKFAKKKRIVRSPVPSAAAAYMTEGPQNTLSMLRRLSADGAQNYVYSQ